MKKTVKYVTLDEVTEYLLHLIQRNEADREKLYGVGHGLFQEPVTRELLREALLNYPDLMDRALRSMSYAQPHTYQLIEGGGV